MIRNVAVTSLILTARIGMPATGTAQQEATSPPNAAELIASFKQGVEAGRPSASVIEVLNQPDAYPPVELRRLMDGLKDIALSRGESIRMRESAVVALAAPGSKRRVRPAGNSLAYLKQVYTEADNDAVRLIAVKSMSNLAEERDVVSFLESLARKRRGDSDYPAAVHWAIYALAGAGEEGRAALKRLDESGAVQDPAGRADLRELAKHDYRLSKSQ
jgi:hypothetical protein